MRTSLSIFHSNDVYSHFDASGGQRALSEVIAYLPVPLPHDPLGESPLLELMLRRLRTRFGAEVAIGQGGVLLGGLPAGPVTPGDLLRVCPCSLNPAVAGMPGRAAHIRYEMDQLLRDTLREALTGQHFVPGEWVRIEIYGLDGRLRKAATVEVKRVAPDEVVLEAGPDYEVEVYEPGKANWIHPHRTVYHLWPGREYNLFRFYTAGGEWVADYYNIIKPFAARPGAICYVDLELDVLLEPGSPATRLLDEDELEQADYPPELKAHIRRLAADLAAVAGTSAAPGGVAPRRR